MKFVIDTNILLSALIKDSITRKIIIGSEWVFCYPEISFHEVRKYKSLVIEKSGISEKEYDSLINLLLKHITLIPEEKFNDKIDEANQLIGKRDPDDIVFLALALSLENINIWSEDKDFEEQNKIKVLKTKDIITLFMEFSDDFSDE